MKDTIDPNDPYAARKKGALEDERKRFKSVIEKIEQPLTLKGLEEFFKCWYTPTNFEEVAENTAIWLSEIKRDFTSEELRKESKGISERVDQYRWTSREIDDHEDFKGDVYWRGKILESYCDRVVKQENPSNRDFLQSSSHPVSHTDQTNESKSQLSPGMLSQKAPGR